MIIFHDETEQFNYNIQRKINSQGDFMSNRNPIIQRILENKDLSEQEQLQELSQLLADEVAKRNASEEGMSQEYDRVDLPDIIDAIHQLGGEVDLKQAAVSKHGVVIKPRD